MLPFLGFLQCSSLHKSLECGCRMSLWNAFVCWCSLFIPPHSHGHPWSVLGIEMRPFWLKNLPDVLGCWFCCWGWWQLASVSSQWWYVEKSFWVGDRDLYLPGDVLWCWGWHCLACSSWMFFNMLLHRCFQVLLPGLGAFLPCCYQRITRLPEWSFGPLGPGCNGIILYLHWIEWCGTRNLQRRRISAPRQSKQWLFSMHTVKWESVMEKAWKHWQRGSVVGVDL